MDGRAQNFKMNDDFAVKISAGYKLTSFTLPCTFPVELSINGKLS